MTKKFLLSFALCLLTLCSIGCNNEKNETSESLQSTEQTEITTATGKVYVTVTDDSGNTVTDDKGNAVTTVQPVIITQIPETTYVTVTDNDGNAVTDDSGNAVTSAQTIWMTTMQTIAPDNQTQSTTTYSNAEEESVATTTTAPQTTTKPADTTTKKAENSSTAASSTSVSTTTAVQTTTTTTADNSSNEDSQVTEYGYGALSTIVYDMIEAEGDGELLHLVFDVKSDANGIYNIEFYDLMISNVDFVQIDYVTANGCVSVGQGIQTDVPTGGNPTAYIAAVEGTAGQQVVVPVMVKNNSGICAFDFKVKYDKSGLTLVNIEKGPLIESDSWVAFVNTEYTPR